MTIRKVVFRKPVSEVDLTGTIWATATCFAQLLLVLNHHKQISPDTIKSDFIDNLHDAFNTPISAPPENVTDVEHIEKTAAAFENRNQAGKVLLDTIENLIEPHFGTKGMTDK